MDHYKVSVSEKGVLDKYLLLFFLTFYCLPQSQLLCIAKPQADTKREEGLVDLSLTGLHGYEFKNASHMEVFCRMKW